jgi:hypothetical protein
LENYRRFCETNPPDHYDFQQGADDDQLANASRLASLVARYWREPNLPNLVEVATKVCQNNPAAIGYMKFNGLFLVELLFGRDIHRALNNAELRLDFVAPALSPEIRQKIQQALGETFEEVTEATLMFGQACPLPQSFPSALHAFLKNCDPGNFASRRRQRRASRDARRLARRTPRYRRHPKRLAHQAYRRIPHLSSIG